MAIEFRFIRSHLPLSQAKRTSHRGSDSIGIVLSRDSAATLSAEVAAKLEID